MFRYTEHEEEDLTKNQSMPSVLNNSRLNELGRPIGCNIRSTEL